MENEISNAKQDMENERNKLKADFDTKLEQHNKEIDEKTKEFETKKKQLEEVCRRSQLSHLILLFIGKRLTVKRSRIVCERTRSC